MLQLKVHAFFTRMKNLMRSQAVKIDTICASRIFFRIALGLRRFQFSENCQMYFVEWILSIRRIHKIINVYKSLFSISELVKLPGFDTISTSQNLRKSKAKKKTQTLIL